MTWTIFLDRDGTLVEDQVHGVDIAKLRLRPGAKEAIAMWRAAGWRVVGITNNSGIARGRYSEAQMHAFHRAIEDALGASFDGWYFCPHLPDAGCACRKPRTKLLEDAIRDLRLDPARSFMIGDSEGDVQAGAAVGARTVFVPAKPGATAKADHVAADLLQAARWTLGQAR